jgi:hypothetical protein
MSSTEEMRCIFEVELIGVLGGFFCYFFSFFRNDFNKNMYKFIL